MRRVEFVEPRIQLGHPVLAVELVRHCPLRQSGDVQPGAARLLVEVVRETDVPAGHTQRIHTLAKRVG